MSYVFDFSVFNWVSQQINYVPLAFAVLRLYSEGGERKAVDELLAAGRAIAGV